VDAANNTLVVTYVQEVLAFDSVGEQVDASRKMHRKK
jgi:hypothetical protein